MLANVRAYAVSTVTPGTNPFGSSRPRIATAAKTKVAPNKP